MKSKENSGEVLLSYTNLRKAALVYIALPMLCFFLGWLKLGCAGIDDRKLAISPKVLIAIILCSCIYLILCGAGRLLTQSGDLLCLAFGVVTPVDEFARGIMQVIEKGINDQETDYIVSLDWDSIPDMDSIKWPQANFVKLDYDDIFFFKYFARDRRTSL